MELIGAHGNRVLFANDVSAVVVDYKKNSVVTSGGRSALLASAAWDDDVTPEIEPVVLELAAAELSTLDVVVAAAGRKYTIPKGVQLEARKALEWRKEHDRGGTPVGMNTARTLANGGQIGIEKVRHIAKYFPRHEVDKKGKGWEPGEDNFPSNGRIAWGLWGSDAGWRWARAIVQRENKAAMRAGGFMFKDLVTDIEQYSTGGYNSDVDAFKLAYQLDTTSSAEFVVRVRMDGSGIDRLFMVNEDGSVLIWDDGRWDDFAHIDGDIKTHDLALDDPYDKVTKGYVVIDAPSAVVVSGHLQSNPYKPVDLLAFTDGEASMFEAARHEVDLEFIDMVITAAGEEAAPVPEGDGQYTEEERSKNASKQVRDATGKFSSKGTKVQAADGTVGNITSVNPETQTVDIEKADGTVVNVPANQTKPYVEPTAEPKQYAGEPLDVSGILGQPRSTTLDPAARIPGTLDPLGPDDINAMLSDWPAWVADQRAGYQALDIPQIDVNENEDDVKTPNAFNDPYLRKWLDMRKTQKGKSFFPNRQWYQPMRKDDVEAKKKAKDVGSIGFNKPKASGPKTQDLPGKNNMPNIQNVPATKVPKNAIVPLKAAAAPVELTPETSDVPPLYMAIVSSDDPRAVLDVVSLLPATGTSIEPTTFKRQDGKWVKDDTILSDLRSATPPPVVPLDNDTLSDVLKQMDDSGDLLDESVDPSTIVSSVYSNLIDVFWNFDGGRTHLLAAGGLDRNRGNAEKLRKYWTKGKGGAKIRWNTPGDWTRCVRHLSKYLGPRAKGYCQLRHKEMTGMWTGDKANRRDRAKALTSDVGIIEFDTLMDNIYLTARRNAAVEKVMVASAGMTTTGARFIIPLVLPEEIESGDGRMFKKDAITMRDFPLPLLWQIKTGEGHMGSVVVGRIDYMERIDGGIGNATGVFDTGAYGREAERLVREGFIRGISADLDKFKAKQETSSEAGNDSEDDDKIESDKMVISESRVMAVTLVPKPAFQECRIQIVNDIDEKQEAEVIPDGIYVDDMDPIDAAALVACGITAGVIPVTPPADWFENPKLSKATPLTITEDGKVFGHIAAWHVDHIGMAFGTKPPRSRSNYAYFHTGAIRTQEGKDVPVGQLTLAGGHASLEASASQAAKHYDDTSSAFADVHAGEDAYGIWVSGALRPGISPENIRAARASAPSGDWRPIKGKLELVAVCQVNVPGFPIARARVASGQVMALVAAGASVLARGMGDPIAELNSRIAKLEQMEHKELSAKMAELSARVKSGETSNKAANTAAVEDIKARFAALKSEMTMTAGGYSIEAEYEAGGMETGKDMCLECLREILSGAANLSFKSQGFHWNVVGSDFAQYHSLFGEIYADIHSSIDPLAENIRKLGGAASSLADLARPDGVSSQIGSPKQMAADLLLANEAFVTELKAAFSLLEQADEQGVADFIAGRIDAHQRWSWQLAASVSPDETVIMADGPASYDMFEAVFSSMEQQGLIASARQYYDMLALDTDARRKLARRGHALPDGSYPISNVDDLKNAIKSYGRSKPSDRAKVRKHIMKRARSLKQKDLIPEKWLAMSASALEFSSQVETLRARVASATAGAEAGRGKELAAEVQDQGVAYKYTAETQPRDARGKFRQVLARLKDNVGESGLQNVVEKIEEAENLDQAGNYTQASRSATELLGLIDRIDTGALNPQALENVRSTAGELGKVIANLPLPFSDQTEKIRFSDLPPALRDLIKDMITRVEDKIGQEDADEATQAIRSFMAGGDILNQSEISSNLSKMLRLLT